MTGSHGCLSIGDSRGARCIAHGLGRMTVEACADEAVMYGMREWFMFSTEGGWRSSDLEDRPLHLSIARGAGLSHLGLEPSLKSNVMLVLAALVSGHAIDLCKRQFLPGRQRRHPAQSCTGISSSHRVAKRGA